MSEYDSIIRQQANSAPGQVVATIDDSPDQAARALELSQATGTAPLAVYNDLEEFQRSHKAAMASGLVRQSPELQEYINAHPLAAPLSNDDFGNLAAFSASAKETGVVQRMLGAPSNLLGATASGVAKGFAEGYGDQPYGSWLDTPYFKANPAAWAVTTAGLMPVEAAVRLLGGVGRGITEGVFGGSEAGYTAATGDAQGGQQFARDIAGLAEYEMNKGEGQFHAPTAAAGEAVRAMEAFRAAEPWLKEGIEPPRGLHPVLDEAKAAINEQALGQLNQDLALAAESMTRTRNPEMFQGFVKQHFGESEIGISGETITSLYGDKLPAPNDGLLGWVPGIVDQLELARETGADVRVPIADWLAKVDPAVAAQLNDDIRVWPGGVTKREVAEAPVEPKVVVDSPLAQIRASTSMEPMFSVGDRKLTLERLANEDTPTGTSFHDFKFVDDTGKDVGYINISQQGKGLYVDMIEGVGGPREFGPSLMRDLMRQLKAEFPDAEYITGHRVSGMRDKAGTFDQKSALPKVRFDADFDVGAAKSLFEGVWKDYYDGQLRVQVAPTELLAPRLAEVNAAVEAEIQRITGGVDYVPATGIETGLTHGTVRGAFIPNERGPSIVLDLMANDPVGTGRHEAIHFLRRQGFLNEAEWATLSEAALAENWLTRYNIRDRYRGLSREAMIEEAIADGFRDWMKNRDQQPDTAVGRVFAKLAELFDSLRQRLGEIFGREVSWEELFRRIDSGEVGKREAGTRDGGPKFSVEENLQNIRAEAAGLDAKSFKKMQDLIQKRYAEDLAAATDRAERQAKRRLTAEWRAQLEQVRAEVGATIRNRPDVAVDMFLSSGELYGEKLDKKYRLATDDLTEAQQAAIPQSYYAKEGLPVDDVAQMFGFANKDAMIEQLAKYTEGKGSKTSRDYMETVIRDEAKRVMEQRHGNLDENIMDTAKDQALSETNLDLLAEEMHGAGMLAKKPTIDKEVARAWVDDQFSKMPVKSVSSERFLQSVGKHGRDAERALIAGDPAAALVAMQKKYLSALLAKGAREFEKAQAKFEKITNKYIRKEVRGVEQEFTDHIQQLMMQAGYKVRVRPEDIARSIEFHGQGDLTEFTDRVRADGWDPAVSPELAAVGAKAEMNVSEWQDFRDAIQSLDHIGRQTNKIEIAGAKEEFAAFRQRVVDNIKTLPARDRAKQDRWIWYADASLTRMEEMVKDLDLRQDLGPLWDAVIRPMALSKSKEFTLMTELADHFRETRGDFGKAWKKSLSDTIVQDTIWDPYTRAPYDMTRENLIQIMLNWGNRSNIDKYVNGAFWAREGKRPSKEQKAAFEQEIKGMIDANAKKEDWEFVSRMWEPFKKWQAEMDVVARNTTGVAPKWIEPKAVETPHGMYEGGYWPVKYDRLGSNISGIEEKSSLTDGVFGQNYFRAASSKGYLKDRTGYVDFVDISTSLEQAAGSMQQTIHDIAFRDALIQGSKVFYDPQIRAAIRKHYGVEYEAQLVPWLKRISYQFVTDDKSAKGANDFLRRMRLNLIGHALPLNLKVILSPDIGVPNPMAWARFEANRTENMKFALEKSEEIKHLVYNLDRDYTEALNKLTQGAGLDDARRAALEWGYKPVAAVSQEFRAATFIDEYNRARGQDKTDTEAALIADSYVRERHGTASIVDQPALLHSNEAMKMLTVFQGYFNAMYNWQRQLPGNVRRGEWNKFAVNALGSVGVGAAFGAALFNKGTEDESWFKTIGKAVVMQPLSTVPGLSHAAQFAFEGFAPRMPFASVLNAMGQTAGDIKKAIAGKPVEKPIANTANVIGLTTGLPLAQIGRTGQFAYDVAKGKQKPRNILEYMRGIITGEARLPK